MLSKYEGALLRAQCKLYDTINQRKQNMILAQDKGCYI